MLDKTCRDIIALDFVPGLGPRKVISLLKEVRETEEIFNISEKRLTEIFGRRFEGAGKIRSVRHSAEYSAELAYMKKNGIYPVCCRDRSYPRPLKDIYDPPIVLYCKGDLRPGDANAVAIVGARRCSLYGLQMAEKLACGLAERGITVISGMASGIDSAAHRGALKARGRTIAVMGSGFRHIFPPGSERLMRAISDSGAVITEYQSDIQPSRGSFPRRNRIISGMAKGVVVVEAARKSGAMITVDLALEQGKEVFAVPGRADHYTSGGTNLLIQNGAKLVTGVDDILEELDLHTLAVPADMENDVRDAGCSAEAAGELSEEDHGILEILKAEETVHADRFIGCAGLTPEKLPEVLLKLEIKGLIKASAGRKYTRV